MIKLKNIKKSYTIGDTSFPVLKGIDIHIKEGEFVSIMGSSGSGKSTL
ncbi:MAG TPA: ATP-binding cassette domain-containing protein, partial [Bacteroidia bacterium]|nr:ATP-binding cassette domain-containing protein [Bacteroidia bacterium]